MSDIGDMTIDTSNRVSTCNTFGYVPKHGPVMVGAAGKLVVEESLFDWFLVRGVVMAAIATARKVIDKPIDDLFISQLGAGGSTESGQELSWSSMRMEEIKRAVSGVSRNTAEKIWEARKALPPIKHGSDRHLEREANLILMEDAIPQINWRSVCDALLAEQKEELDRPLSNHEGVFDIFPTSGEAGSWDYIPGKTKALAFIKTVDKVQKDHENAVMSEDTQRIYDRIHQEL